MSTDLDYHLLREIGKAAVLVDVYLRVPLLDRMSKNVKSTTR